MISHNSWGVFLEITCFSSKPAELVLQPLHKFCLSCLQHPKPVIICPLGGKRWASAVLKIRHLPTALLLRPLAGKRISDLGVNTSGLDSQIYQLCDFKHMTFRHLVPLSLKPCWWRLNYKLATVNENLSQTLGTYQCPYHSHYAWQAVIRGLWF